MTRVTMVALRNSVFGIVFGIVYRLLMKLKRKCLLFLTHALVAVALNAHRCADH
uniref:Uncharacterized protein n=1 Tax=Anguilla anguilla TaxID=7936 RepID=A0A0E9VHE9_ANGAN